MTDDKTRKVLRTLRWICWTLNVLAYLPLLIQGTNHLQNPHARTEWIVSFIFNTANFVLFMIEHRRKTRALVEAY